MPPNLYTTASDGLPNMLQLGGKGASLAKLAKRFRVPSFVIIPTAFFEGETAQPVLQKAASLLPQIEKELGRHKYFAVRSSATIEDGANHSFAGQFSTLLNVAFNDLPQAIVQVWQSGFSDVVKAYKQNSKISVDHQMAVIVQQMVAATASGVAFGINPLTGNRNEIVINAVAGLGESLVSGQQNADLYVVSNGSVSKTVIAGKTAALSMEQVMQVVSLLEEVGGGAQDIEFAFEEDTLHLLQSRPITATGIGGEQIVWDNSNIVESYPGLTLPLTFSFIEKMYEAVYRQFSLVLGVGKKTVEANAAIYASMLGLLNGRVYYNLNSWYRSLAQLPGYSVNADFMEKMMGVKEKLPIDMSSKAKAGIKDYWQIVSAVSGVLKSLFNAKKSKRQFVAAFENVYSRFDKKDYVNEELSEILNDYTSFEQLMVSRWKAPLVNDLFAMIYFGLLQKQCMKWAPELPNLHNVLIASSKDIITTEPMRRLPLLAKQLADNEVLKELFLNSDAATAWQQLHQPEFAEYKAAIDDYISVWGERSVAELKLETITYRQQPERLIGLLQSYIQNGIFSYPESKTAIIEREKSEQIIQQRLQGKWLQQKLFRHVLWQARYFVSNRENLRYYRTKGFGMVRRMMIATGEVLWKKGWLENSSDVFYLQLPEVLNLLQNPDVGSDFKRVVIERKKDYGLYEKMPLPERIFTVGKPEKFILSKTIQPIVSENNPVLQGIPCSAGVVRSKISIVKEATALQSLNGNILATYATDPGWVVLFPSASGILTERGSLLSHAAIVSREMGIPCIVAVEGLMQVPDGAEVLMDGSTGRIHVLNTPAA